MAKSLFKLSERKFLFCEVYNFIENFQGSNLQHFFKIQYELCLFFLDLLISKLICDLNFIFLLQLYPIFTFKIT